MRLQNKVAIVTGGGHGIGAKYCEGLAREGAKVAIAEIDAKAAEEVAQELTAKGHQAIAIPTDVSDEASTLNMAKTVRDKFGRIDVLINNAAIFATVAMSRVNIEEIPVDEWDRMMTVNLKGVFLSCRAVLPAMKAQEGGSIINISSGTALFGSPTRIHYVTTKAGVIGFTRSLAREVGGFNIRINCIAPGSTLSEKDPTPEIVNFRKERIGSRALKRVEYPEDLVGAAIFLASDDAGFISGQTLVVDGGAVMV